MGAGRADMGHLDITITSAVTVYYGARVVAVHDMRREVARELAQVRMLNLRLQKR